MDNSYEYDVEYTGINLLMIDRNTGEKKPFVQNVTGIFSKNINYHGDIFTRKFENQGDVVYTMQNTAYTLIASID
tara:strand:- start:1630 stop:1854 length:225 start_codon:yes stop_codon:yes gene_type:complete